MEILSPREREVLTAAARGLSVVETGRALYLSPDTVKTYRRHINRHLGARNMTQAVAVAITSGLLEPWEISPPAPADGRLRAVG
jgi:DNA-binding NarL/FixJ family response regulator